MLTPLSASLGARTHANGRFVWWYLLVELCQENVQTLQLFKQRCEIRKEHGEPEFCEPSELHNPLDHVPLITSTVSMSQPFLLNLINDP